MAFGVVLEEHTSAIDIVIDNIVFMSSPVNWLLHATLNFLTNAQLVARSIFGMNFIRIFIWKAMSRLNLTLSDNGKGTQQRHGLCTS